MDLLAVVAFIFAVSFVSNATPFFGFSYTLAAALELLSVGFTPFNFLVVVWASALGAALAKVVIYFGAFGLRDLLVKNKNVQLIGRNSSKGGFYLILFATALLPVLPLDDFIYIGAGASGASLGLMTAVTLLGKLLKSAFEIAIEFTLLNDLIDVFGFNRLDVTLALGAVFIAIGIVVYKLDWEKAYSRIRGTKPQNQGNGTEVQTSTVNGA